jgi:hypothetical protein
LAGHGNHLWSNSSCTDCQGPLILQHTREDN